MPATESPYWGTPCGNIAREGRRLVGAIGVMFTVAGHNDIRAVYPNISLKYFFDEP